MSKETLKIKEESINNDDFSENLRAAAGIKQIQLQDEAEKMAEETNIPNTRMIGGHQFFKSQRDNGYRSENQALSEKRDISRKNRLLENMFPCRNSVRRRIQSQGSMKNLTNLHCFVSTL